MQVEFDSFRKTDNDMLNLYRALTECKQIKADGLYFSKGEYHFTDEFAFERALCISNHGENGFKRTAFLLEDKNDFVIDGGGSRFVFDSVMNMITVLNCKNIVLRNFTVSMPVAPYVEGKVIAVTDNSFDLEFSYYSDVIPGEKSLSVKNGAVFENAHCNIEFNGKTHEIEYGTGDQSACMPLRELKKEKISDKVIRFFDPPRIPKIGNILAFMIDRRPLAGLFFDGCTDIKIENVTINSCMGIGIMAQCCENITVNGCRVTSEEGKYVSSGADATHFVSCTGKITVENCLFEHMLDDALNVHGIYLKIIKAEQGRAIVKFCNSYSSGIDLLKKGDKVCEMDAKTLLPKKEATILSAVKINNELIEITFNEPVIVREGDVIENITASPELLLKHCIIRNNRARGVLIASKSCVIEDCDFHTSGAAVVLECDGRYWYESGAVKNLVIRNNRFDGCKHAEWENGVISVPQREASIEGEYYHGIISIIGNSFISCFDDPVYAANISRLIYRDNTSDKEQVLHLKHIGNTDIQPGAIIK